MSNVMAVHLVTTQNSIHAREGWKFCVDGGVKMRDKVQRNYCHIWLSLCLWNQPSQSGWGSFLWQAVGCRG